LRTGELGGGWKPNVTSGRLYHKSSRFIFSFATFPDRLETAEMDLCVRVARGLVFPPFRVWSFSESTSFFIAAVLRLCLYLYLCVRASVSSRVWASLVGYGARAGKEGLHFVLRRKIEQCVSNNTTEACWRAFLLSSPVSFCEMLGGEHCPCELQ